MTTKPVILFVCEHGAAKSVIAAAYFNRLAAEAGLDSRAVARGTNPDADLSPKAVHGLREDGLLPTEPAPQTLSQVDLESAQQIVTFCDLPEDYEPKARVEHWNDVPPVSESYENARDAIVEHIESLIHKLR